LAASENLTQIRLRVRQLCNDVTHSENADRRIGVEKNKLLQPDWEATWSHDRQVYTALFLRLGEIVPGEHAEYLYEAFRQLVRFVADGKTDHIRQRIAQDLYGALGDYLSLRGYATPTSSAGRIPPAVHPTDSTGGPPKDEWTRHHFAILVNEKTRTIRRDGYDKDFDLSSSGIGWHIFSVALRAAPKQAALKDLQTDYPGEWSARSVATQDLNRRLAPVRIKVHDRTLVEVLD
jgi:hypothetical protein